MSPFNVHVNRAPLDGTVEDVIHREGRFRPAYSDEAPMENESTTMMLSTSYGQVLVRQIAGILARRTVCRVKPGDSLRRGERYGLIKFGSRVDIYLPKSAEILVKVNDRVKAGSTVLARMVEK
jgi:phosphatidylserine decarboxylase